METKYKYRSLIVLIIIVIAIFFLVLSEAKDSSDKAQVNEDVIQARSFSICSDSADINTSAKGTVFIKGSERIPEQVQIIALIEVDSDDWGGVAFYIPKRWQISGITSSYPENESRTTPADSVATWTAVEPGSEWGAMIEFGRDRSYVPAGGGTGTVVINLVPDETAMQLPETFNCMVAVGSDEKDGVKIAGSDDVLIEVPLT